jgi:hypothetical protein
MLRGGVWNCRVGERRDDGSDRDKWRLCRFDMGRKLGIVYMAVNTNTNEMHLVLLHIDFLLSQCRQYKDLPEFTTSVSCLSDSTSQRYTNKY